MLVVESSWPNIELWFLIFLFKRLVKKVYDGPGDRGWDDEMGHK